MHWHHSSTSQLCIYGDGPELVLGTSYKWPRLRRLPPKTETPKTKMLKILLEMRPRRDVGTSRDRDVKTETTTLCSKQRGFFHQTTSSAKIVESPSLKQEKGTELIKKGREAAEKHSG